MFPDKKGFDLMLRCEILRTEQANFYDHIANELCVIDHSFVTMAILV